MVAGKRDIEILNELQVSDYDLFTEGILHAFEPTNFRKKISSRLYRNLPCPALMVKNLVNLDKGVLALGEDRALPSCISVFLKLFEKVQVELDLICCRFEDKQDAEGSDSAAGQATGLHTAENMLDEKGRTARTSRVAQAASDCPEQAIRDYGLVLTSLSRENLEENPIVDLLSRTPCPVLIGWH
jgi:hypothetical protein